MAGASDYSVDINGRQYRTATPYLDTFELLTSTTAYTLKVAANSNKESLFPSDWSEPLQYKIKGGKRWLMWDVQGGVAIAPDDEAKSYSGKVIIPAYDEGGQPVVEIQKNAFEGYNKITGIVIPRSVKIIRANAFQGCTSLKRVRLPASLEQITNGAFANCTALESLSTIPASTVSIGYRAFEGCSQIKSLTVHPNNFMYESVNNCLLQTINGDSMLIKSNAANEIPDGVESIGQFAFADNPNLTSITLPDSVVGIGTGAFSRCTNLKSIDFSKNLESISRSAFKNCSSLTKITIPDRVTQLIGTVFQNCTSLKEVHIPKSVTLMRGGIFAGCTNLERITVADDNPNYQSVNNCILSKSGEELVYAPRGAAIPAVTRIADYAFEFDTFAEFTIPVGVKEIGKNAFAACENLQRVFIPQGVTTIGYEAFSGCPQLSVVLPETVTEIAQTAFDGSELDSFVQDPNAPHLTVYVPFESTLSQEQISCGTCVAKCELAYENGYPYVAAIATKSSATPSEQGAADTPLSVQSYYRREEGCWPFYVPTRIGYEFQGWATEEGGEVVYQNATAKGFQQKDYAVTLTEEQLQNIPYDSKLYAIWEKTA